MDSALAFLAKTVSADGDEFFHACVREFAHMYGAGLVFIALVDEGGTSAPPSY